MEKKIAILLAFNVLLLLTWRLFNLSFDNIDLFLFYELEQHPKWYAYYTSVYLRELIQWVVIYALIPTHFNYIKALSLFLIIMTVLRCAIYWLFNSSINLEVQVSCIVLYLMLAILWRK